MCWNSERIITDQLDQLHSNEIRYDSYCMTPNVLPGKIYSTDFRLFRFISHSLMAYLYSMPLYSRFTSVPHRYYTGTTLILHWYNYRIIHQTYQFSSLSCKFEMICANCLPVCIYVRVLGSVNLKSFRDKSYKCGYT